MPRKRSNRRQTSIPIGQRLFRLVEADQGKGFISDALEDLPDAAVISIVRDVALPRSRRAVKKMAAWLRKYEHLGHSKE